MSPLAYSVAISVSDPGSADLAARGLLREHVDHAFIETARQVLAGGGALAYGGDLRQGGFTETLKALLDAYSDEDRPAWGRVRQYLARPVWSAMTPGEASDVATAFSAVHVQGADAGAADQVGRARDFTAMREIMTAETDARIVIGGNPVAGEGPWPGVVEEAWLSIRAGQPLFVCGGLGGAGALVAEAVRGEWPRALTAAYQVERGRHTRELEQAGVPPAEGDLRETLRGAELRNGLGSEDNELLMVTTDLDMAIALILRGLNALETTPAA